MLKRLFDFFASFLGLLLLLPGFALIALAIKLSSAGPVFYRGVRAGLLGKPFRIFKFRTMVVNADKLGGPSTSDDDPRITRAGKFLRKHKLDELPQLLNVLKGEMSLVGPRPEVPQYVELFTAEERAILTVRPGITDWATLWNPDEGAVLTGSTDAERVYLEKIRPTKIALQLAYVRKHSFSSDLAILFQTLRAIFVRSKSGALGVVERVKPAQDVNSTDVSLDLLREMYCTMLRIRFFEERVGDLVEAGEVKTPCHLYIGQEAIAAGVCSALNKDDYAWGGHRSHGHFLAKGGDMRAMMAEIHGKSTGCSHGRGGSMHLLAPEVGILGTVPLVSATIPLAVGSALAAKLRSERRVSLSFFGDGATEEGHFHESVNLAAVYQLPVVFVCENNFYASHMSLLERRAKDNICETSIAHGIPGIRVDGNDVIAVYHAAREAIQKARNGGGPTLLECRTYRWRGHVGPSWDMDVGVKRKDELNDWLPRDPVARLSALLQGRGVLQESLRQTEQEVQDEVEAAVIFARQSPYPEKSDLLKHVFWCEKEANADAVLDLL